MGVADSYENTDPERLRPSTGSFSICQTGVTSRLTGRAKSTRRKMSCKRHRSWSSFRESSVSEQETFICTRRASPAYRNAIILCCGTNLSTIFISGCPRNVNGRRSGRVQTRRFTELRSTQRCVFSAVV